MRLGPPIVLPHATYVTTFRGFSRGYSAVSIAAGIVLLAGGGPRFSSASLETARQIADAVTGGTVRPAIPWGLAIGLAGIAGLAGSLLRVLLVIRAAVVIEFLWYLFFAFTLGFSALNDTRAGLLGIVAFGGLALAGINLSAALADARQDAATAAHQVEGVQP